MKKLYIILALVVVSFMVFAGNPIKLLHIYHNGSFTAIPLSDIENIDHSMFDTDNIQHNNYVTTVIKTKEAEIKIPIADVDSAVVDDMMVTIEEVSPIREDYEVIVKGQIMGYDSNKSYRCDLIIREGVDVISSLNFDDEKNHRITYLVKRNDGSFEYRDLMEFLDINTTYGFAFAVEYEGKWYFSKTRFCSFDLCPDDHHPHFIDLGLPSGTKWACCNMDASNPHEFGSYFAFGEKDPKECYDWDSYQHKVFPSYAGDVSTYDKEMAWPDNDASFVKSDSLMMMPTLEQVTELNVFCSEKKAYDLDGVKGLLIRGSNGGVIFLPAGGYKEGYNHNNVDRGGYFWTYQSLYGIGGWVWGFSWSAFKEGESCVLMRNQFRGPTGANDGFVLGRNIRPILSPEKNPYNP